MEEKALDTLLKLEIIQLVEQKYGIEIQDEEIETINSIQDLIEMVKRKK